MYRITTNIGVDRWGRSFLSGVVLALAIATLAMFIAIPVWHELRGVKAQAAPTDLFDSSSFRNEVSIPIRTEQEVASNSAIGI